MIRRKIYHGLTVTFLLAVLSSCTPSLVQKTVDNTVPDSYNNSLDTHNTARVNWKDYFTDPFLTALIETALRNNQELNIMLQEIEISRNEVSARKGEYLPFVGVTGAADVEKVGRYTRFGASEANTEIKPGTETPDPLPNYMVGAFATWEVDIWNKLHNAKKSAALRFLSSVEGKNFMVTQLIAEIANSYFELLALDNQLVIVQQNIEIQNNAFEIMKIQKLAARVTELAVRRFEAQVLNTKGLQFGIQQRITETENKINFLIGRYPQTIERNTQTFKDLVPNQISAGIPTQLLENRPDVKQAELQLEAAKVDIKVAKANFYPSLALGAALGVQSFSLGYIAKMPASLLYSIGGDITGPLINRRAIKAAYMNANAMQIQAVYNYQRTMLQAYIEVANQLSMISNMEQSYELKSQEVEALTESITISNSLFSSARADYMEVLLTQRDALESRFELIETKRLQMNAAVNIYKALGGGWN